MGWWAVERVPGPAEEGDSAQRGRETVPSGCVPEEQHDRGGAGGMLGRRRGLAQSVVEAARE